MSAVSSYGIGRAGIGGEGDVLWVPKGYKRDGSLRGVVYLHGAGELSSTALAGSSTFAKPKESELLRRIASTYPLVAVDAGTWAQGGVTDSNNWGNAHGQAAVGGAITWLQAAGGGGAKVGQVVLVGISMGHLLSLTYAQANPANVLGIVGILPLNDLDDLRDNDRGGAGYRAGISNAWGTAAWTAPGTPALPAGANPALPANQTNLKGIPQKMWAANDDAICPIATVNALKANLGSKTTLVNMGNSGGHSDASIGAVQITDVLTFIAGLG